LRVGSAGRAEGWFLWRLAGDAGDDLHGDLAELDVAVLGCRPDDGEGFGGGAPLLAYDHAEGLVDDGPGGQRGAQLWSVSTAWAASRAAMPTATVASR
jgi:hypothetical protein